MNKDENKNASVNEENKTENLALDDERRIKVLSPSMLVFKRFIRNRLAIVGTIFILGMFAFAFIGGILSPYGESEVFRGYEEISKDYASVTENTEFRYTDVPGMDFPSIAKAKFFLSTQQGNEKFEGQKGVFYTLEKLGDNAYAIFNDGGELISVASKAIFDAVSNDSDINAAFRYAADKAIGADEKEFTADGAVYTIKESGDDECVIYDAEGKEFAYVSSYIVNPVTAGTFLTIEEKAAIKDAVFSDAATYEYDGKEYTVTRQNLQWNIKTLTSTQLILTYQSPSKEHWLGTDGNGMDIFTRLMYGGRVSLLIGFIVEFIETLLGVILGGVSGYFGGWVDNLIMRIVDIFNCIPSTPLIIILGAMMDAMQVDPKMRMLYLMLILGFLGWPGVARLVRGQILSLREQEFMTATEATGLSVSRRIFKHLVPNVIPQLIVICTMGLGGVILTESTLSFLGLGVKFPFASWGNIINAVSNVYVMTNYWFVWIPAGFCILITVLGFNFVGDGLRDAFDPKMKR